MTTYTKEQKREHFASLRERWQETKDKLTAGEMKAIDAVIAEHGLNISAVSFALVSAQMRHLGYDGIPYLDCKTYRGWHEAGFQVTRGERSHIRGIVWIKTERTDGQGEVLDDDDQFTFPKEYHLFHRSQVSAATD